MAKLGNPLDTCKYFLKFIFFIPRFANSELAKRAEKAPRFTATRHTLMKFEIFRIYCTNIAHIFEICKKASDASRTEGSKIVLFMYFIFMCHETKSI